MSTILRNAFSLTRLSFWSGVLLSSLVGASAYVLTSRSIESDARARFLDDAVYAQKVIMVRIKSYTDLLRGSASLIHSSAFSHRKLHEYVRGLDLKKNYPAFDNINFALYVTRDRRDAFTAQLQQELQPYIANAGSLQITPPGTRPSYLIVSYVEPDLFGLGHYGVDLLANPFFGRRLDDERDQGTVQASGTPIPALSKPNDPHLGMRMAVFRPGAQIESVEQRRAAYIGSLGIAFSLPKLLQGVIGEMPISHVRMTVYDIGPGVDSSGRAITGRALPLFDSQGTSDLPTPALASGNDVFTATLPLDFNSRPWKIVYSVPKAALYTDFDSSYPILMMAFSFVASMLLYALLHTLTTSRRAALGLAQEMTSELRASQNNLQLSHQKLRRLADHAYQIKELERKRIAREIHDDLGQNLLALRIDTEMLSTRTRGKHSHLHARARATLQQIDTIIKSVRQIINDLRPTVLDLGLSAAVEWQLSQFQRRTGIVCELVDEHGEIALSDHCATAFFRILQESLTNVVRHAHASRVVVELRLNAGWLSMSVKDNGCGLPPGGHNKFGSFGLVGIEERVLILGGTCTVFSEPGAGTTVLVSAPVADTSPLFQSRQEQNAGSAVI